MTELYIGFIFSNFLNPDIAPETLYNIRRLIALTFEQCHFGISREHDNHFANEFATPNVDNYYFNELDAERPSSLQISYVFPYPIEHGDIGKLVSTGFQSIHEYIRRNYNDIHCSISFNIDDD